MEELREKIIKFRDERNWKQFHTPAILARTLSIDSNHLLELFQWKDSYKKKDEVCEKLADIVRDCFLMADALGVDLKKITIDKINEDEKNIPSIKYRNKLTIKTNERKEK